MLQAWSGQSGQERIGGRRDSITLEDQPALGVGDASLRMHRLHDVLQFFETLLKNRIVKN